MRDPGPKQNRGTIKKIPKTLTHISAHTCKRHTQFFNKGRLRQRDPESEDNPGYMVSSRSTKLYSEIL